MGLDRVQIAVASNREIGRRVSDLATALSLLGPLTSSCTCAGLLQALGTFPPPSCAPLYLQGWKSAHYTSQVSLRLFFFNGRSREPTGRQEEGRHCLFSLYSDGASGKSG